MTQQVVNAPVRITVLRRTVFEESSPCKAGKIAPCERLEDGQVFVSKGANMPEGFCSWAWADIQKYVLTLGRGGNLIGAKHGTFVTCCTDGYRPVFFLVERMEEQRQS
ncbi:MAG: TIGR04076 family protein [Planctomycetes bacterium]|nr:TIGR04076 family protein [Planctomycetota bacterium]MBM4082343.1 TIGR04076 family protein [Planctomycetota bacterium]